MFDLKDGRVIIDPNMLMIPQFANIWDRDTTEHKEVAMKELAYIYYTCNFKSPYMQYDEDIRETYIINDYMPSGWKIDSTVNIALAKYRSFNRTPSMDLMDSAKVALKTLGKRLEDPDLPTKDLLASLKQLKETVNNYDELKQAVERELLNSESRTKGQVKIRDRERVK